MLDGTQVSLEIRGHTITKVGEVNAPGVDIKGMWLVPAFIDSHVHLTLLPAAEEMARSGIAGVVDLASPRIDDRAAAGKLFMKSSGPMITPTRGYPTQSWGRGGYGREVSSKKAARAAVDKLVKQGADVIKIPLGPNGLTVKWAQAVVKQAHKKHKKKVVAHALGSEEAAFAADMGVDVLAHMPVESMDQETLDILSKRAVVTTLAAFGGSPGAIRNLRELRERGSLILYGTDLGNSKIAGIHPDEIELMVSAGMDGAAIIDAATAQPAEFWGFKYLGAIAEGKAASFLLLAENPLEDPMALTRPSHVYIDGVRTQ